MRRIEEDQGQMTVELCIVFPVIIIVAVIAVNALLFFSECAAFDRISRNAVASLAASPSTQDDQAALAAQIASMVSQEMGNEDIECVACGAEGGMSRFRTTLSFHPTLFGMGLADEVWGVPLPKLTHVSELALDVYAPQAQVMTDG